MAAQLLALFPSLPLPAGLTSAILMRFIAELAALHKC